MSTNEGCNIYYEILLYMKKYVNYPLLIYLNNRDYYLIEMTNYFQT